jgi:hypothetical protein
LANLVPQQSIRTRPSTSTIATMLSRAYLPLETIALAACVLDALSSQFGRSWRNSLSKLSPSSASSFPSEIIVLAALKVSASFLDDSRTVDPGIWAAHVGGVAGITAAALETTVRVVLADIGYEMCSFTPEEVERRRRGMLKTAEVVAAKANTCDETRHQGVVLEDIDHIWIHSQVAC